MLPEELGAATVHPKQVTPASVSPHLYSNVAMLRPSSTASQHDHTHLDVGIQETCSAPTTPFISDFSSQVDWAFNDESILISSTWVMTENPPNNGEEHWPWTLVESKPTWRHRSFLTYEDRKPVLTTEQETAIKTAKQNLTTAKQTRISHWYDNIYMNDESKPLKGKGPS